MAHFEKVSTNGLQQIFSITLEANDISNEIINSTKNRAKNVKMAGFRPGKVPLTIIQSKYKNEILNDTFNTLVADACKNIIEKNNIKELAIKPLYKFEAQYEDGKDAKITVTLESVPEFDIHPYEFKITKIIPDILQSDIEELQKEVIKNNPVYQDIKEQREIKLNDRVQYSAKCFNKGKADNKHDIKSQNIIIQNEKDELVHALLGKKVNDEFDFTLPQNKNITYKVKINNIQEPIYEIKPEEYASKQGFKSIEDFNNALKEQISSQIARQLYLYHKGQIVESLIAQYAFDLPPSVIEQEIQAVIRQVKHEAENEKKSDEELKKEYLDAAKKRVLLGYIFNKIAQKENINAQENEINNLILQEINSNPNHAQEIINQYKNHPELISYKRAAIIEQKIVDFLISKATCTEEKKTIKEIKNKLDEFFSDDN